MSWAYFSNIKFYLYLINQTKANILKPYNHKWFPSRMKFCYQTGFHNIFKINKIMKNKSKNIKIFIFPIDPCSHSLNEPPLISNRKHKVSSQPLYIPYFLFLSTNQCILCPFGAPNDRVIKT